MPDYPASIRTFELPPKGFDPTKAPASDLKKYGLPTPDERSAGILEFWKDTFAKSQTTNLKYVHPQFEEVKILLPTAAHPSRSIFQNRPLLPDVDRRWSGAICLGDPADKFVAVHSNFSVPAIYEGPKPPSYSLIVGPGLDGYRGGFLFAGVLCHWPNDKLAPTYSFGYMWDFGQYNNNSVSGELAYGFTSVRNVSVKPDDEILVWITVDQDNSHAHVYLRNYTSNEGAVFQVGIPVPLQFFHGLSAEVLVANVMALPVGTPSRLYNTAPPYSMVSFTSAAAYTSSSKLVGLGTGYTAQITDDRYVIGTVLSRARVLGDQQIWVSYVGE